VAWRDAEAAWAAAAVAAEWEWAAAAWAVALEVAWAVVWEEVAWAAAAWVVAAWAAAAWEAVAWAAWEREEILTAQWPAAVWAARTQSVADVSRRSTCLVHFLYGTVPNPKKVNEEQCCYNSCSVSLCQDFHK
jgi:hypothetical protein